MGNMTVTIESIPPEPVRSWKQAVLRGAQCKCPACGEGKAYTGFMKIADRCASCGAELHHHRADDAPPYFTIFIVGHIVVPLVLLVERAWQPDLWVHAVLWLVVTLALTLFLMPRVKAAVVGLQWALRMHGFGLEHPASDRVD
jgi:uncharacterized protein (DUF983 family)